MTTLETTLFKTHNAALVLADGAVFFGQGFGATGEQVGELCFTTGMTGYQETLTDPSFAKQIITFTFPHIGNVGCNDEDIECPSQPYALGLITRELPTLAANQRAKSTLDEWLKSHNLIGLAGIDTRALTHRLREKGAVNAVLAFSETGDYDIEALTKKAQEWPGLDGMDVAKDVTCPEPYTWTETTWAPSTGYGQQTQPRFNVAVLDYGCKRNILRQLASHGCGLTVFPASATAADILASQPNGIFLSNGPGDPAPVGAYTVPVIRELMDKNIPVFGICLGHQLLSLALGATTKKLKTGHRGANHPVLDKTTGKVEITSQNHGFCVVEESLPEDVNVTHTSLFDGTNEGIAHATKPAFSVQYHPEASPGPMDSHYLFARFIKMMEDNRQKLRGAA